MIHSLELTNFKSFRHQKIGLERLTVFVGANASGKTSILEAIRLAVSAARRRLRAPLGRLEQVLLEQVFGRERPLRLAFHAGRGI